MPSAPQDQELAGRLPYSRDHGGSLERSLALVRFLRRACDWDAKQTPESLVPHLLEESREVAEAIRSGDLEQLEGELGDLLLNLAFQIVIGEESGRFDAESVTTRLEAKMVRRHPHLFGLGERRDWESMKAAEAGVEGVLEGVPEGLEPLLRAYRLQERAAGVGFDWPDWRGALEKLREELHEVGASAESDPLGEETREEVGDLLFAAINVVRLLGHHPDEALTAANHKFQERFRAVEAKARDRGLEVGAASLDELEALWLEVKTEEA